MYTNTTNTEAMTCILGNINMALLHEAFANIVEGHYNRQSWQMRQVNGDICGLELATAPLQHHQESH